VSYEEAEAFLNGSYKKALIPLPLFEGEDVESPLGDKILDFYRESDRVSYFARLKPMPTPVTLQEIEVAESKLGFKIPSLLKELYVQVGNGSFSPEIMGIDNGWTDDLNQTAIDSYVTDTDALREYNAELAELSDKLFKHRLPMGSGGCQYVYLLDCRTDEGQVLRWSANGLAEDMGWDLMAHTLREWLEKWLGGGNCHIPIIEDYRPV
jgi:SMI1 / KNR4 family (SUKH-1)